MIRYLLLLLLVTSTIVPMDRMDRKSHRKIRRKSYTEKQWLPSSSSSDSTGLDPVPEYMDQMEAPSKTKTGLKGLAIFLAISSCGGDLTSLAGIYNAQKACSPITAYPLPPANSTDYPSWLIERPDCSYALYTETEHPAYSRGSCPHRDGRHSCIIERCSESDTFEIARDVTFAGQITALTTKLPFLLYGAYKAVTWK